MIILTTIVYAIIPPICLGICTIYMGVGVANVIHNYGQKKDPKEDL